MSVTGQIESEQSSHQRGSAACKPLIDAATKDLFRNNAFRITGLPVDASPRERNNHNVKIKQLAELKKDPHTQDAAFPIKPPPGLDEIREAIQKLNDPQKRFVDEFFWFWPQEHGQNKSDAAIQALAKGDSKTAIEIWKSKENSTTDGVVAAHNLALVYHINALDWENYFIKNEVEAEQRQKITDYWKRSFKRWERLASDELFWGKVAARIRQLDEPNISDSFARRMRASLPEALAKISAELAVAFAAHGKIESARLHIQLMREWLQGHDYEKIAELVLSPARKRIKEQIQRAKISNQQNRAAAHEAARILIDQAHPLLEVFHLFFGEQAHFQKEIFDEVATTAVNCLVTYQRKTGDNTTFVKLLERVMPLAESIEVRRRIEEFIVIGKGNLNQPKLDPVYKLLKSIQDSKMSPSERLGKFNAEVANVLISAMSGLARGSEDYNKLWNSVANVLRGISLDAWNNHHDRQTAIAAHELAIKYATSAELKKQLAEDRKTLQQVRQEAGLTPITSAPSLGTLNGIGLKLYGSTDTDPETGSYLSTYYFVFLYIPIFPICRYRVTSTGNSYRFFGNAPLRSFDKWHRVISIGLIILLMVLLSSASNTSTPSSSSSYTQPVSQPAPNIFDQFDKNTTPSGSSAYNSGGNTYQVSSAASAELDRDSATIDLEKAKAQKLDKQLEAYNRTYENEKAQADALQSELESLGSEIESDRSTLDRENQSELDDFNDKVNRYNALLQDVRVANANVNQWADAYNSLLERVRAQNRVVNQLVDSYNAKLRQYGH